MPFLVLLKLLKYNWPFFLFLYQTFYHTILSTSAKTFLFLVNSSCFYNTLKFKKFPPSWFMAVHRRRLGLAVNDVILILNFSKKQKFKTKKDEYLKYCVECCQLQNWNAIRQCFCYKLRRSYLALMSFVAISSLLSDAAINQNGGNSLEFQSYMKQKILGQN